MKQGKGKIGMSASAKLVRGGGHHGGIRVPKFRYDCELWRGGMPIDAWSAENVVTTQGASSLLDVYFDAAAQITTWYLGLISSASYTTPPAIGNTAANLSAAGNGWAECSASYAPNYDTPAGTNRAAITFDEPTGTDPVSLTSSSTVDITFSETGTVKGAFIAAGTARLSTTAPLYSAALFSGDKSVVDNDQLKVTVTVSLDLVYTP
jgi:hypothetical protein